MKNSLKALLATMLAAILAGACSDGGMGGVSVAFGFITFLLTTATLCIAMSEQDFK